MRRRDGRPITHASGVAADADVTAVLAKAGVRAPVCYTCPCECGKAYFHGFDDVGALWVVANAGTANGGRVALAPFNVENERDLIEALGRMIENGALRASVLPEVLWHFLQVIAPEEVDAS